MQKALIWVRITHLQVLVSHFTLTIFNFVTSVQTIQNMFVLSKNFQSFEVKLGKKKEEVFKLKDQLKSF